jgi:hypothetical protein
MAGSGIRGRGWLVPVLLPDPRRVRRFRRNPASCPHPWEDRHRPRRSDCLHADDDRLPPRLQRLPVIQDRSTCRRRRGVERADAGYLNPIGAPIAHAGMHIAAVLHSPQTDTFLPHTNSQSAGLLSAAAERQSCVVHALPSRRRQCNTALGLLPSCSAMSFCDSSHLIQCNQLSRLGGAEPRMPYALASIAD